MKQFEAYKFTKKAVAEIMTGQKSIRLSRLSYFREMDNPTSSPWISDCMEGLLKSHSNDRIIVDRGASQAARTLVADTTGVWVDASSGPNLIQGNTVIMRSPDVFIFCLALPPFGPVKQAMCHDAPLEYRYDACFGIRSVGDLFDALLDQARYDGLSLRELFGGSKHDQVKYSTKTSSFPQSMPRDSIFLKDEIFQPQQEYRFAFGNEKSHLGPTIDVDLSSFSDFFERLF